MLKTSGRETLEATRPSAGNKAERLSPHLHGHVGPPHQATQAALAQHGDPSLSTTMKSFASLLALASVVVATPLLGGEQLPLGDIDSTRFDLGELATTYPGVSLDLNERRLVQLEGQPPKWVTELEKVCFMLFVSPRANVI